MGDSINRFGCLLVGLLLFAWGPWPASWAAEGRAPLPAWAIVVDGRTWVTDWGKEELSLVARALGGMIRSGEAGRFATFVVDRLGVSAGDFSEEADGVRQRVEAVEFGGAHGLSEAVARALELLGKGAAPRRLLVVTASRDGVDWQGLGSRCRDASVPVDLVVLGPEALSEGQLSLAARGGERVFHVARAWQAYGVMGDVVAGHLPPPAETPEGRVGPRLEEADRGQKLLPLALLALLLLLGFGGAMAWIRRRSWEILVLSGDEEGSCRTLSNGLGLVVKDGRGRIEEEGTEGAWNIEGGWRNLRLRRGSGEAVELYDGDRAVEDGALVTRAFPFRMGGVRFLLRPVSAGAIDPSSPATEAGTQGELPEPPPEGDLPRLLDMADGCCLLVLVRTRSSIGRDPTNDLVLDDPGVARRHVDIDRDGATCLLFLRPGAKERVLDGRSETGSTLRSGQILQLGEHRLVFASSKEDEEHALHRARSHCEVKKWYCRHCGNEIRGDSNFCRHCGMSVEEH